jgi:hypothetical protein
MSIDANLILSQLSKFKTRKFGVDEGAYHQETISALKIPYVPKPFGCQLPLLFGHLYIVNNL